MVLEQSPSRQSLLRLSTTCSADAHHWCLGRSGKLQFDLAGAAPHRADQNLHVVAQPGHQFQ